MLSSRLLGIALAALSITACGWECGTIRRTVANGTLRDAAGATLATVQVELAEDVGPSRRRLSVGVMGPAGSQGAPLRGRVTRTRLVSETGELIAEIPTGTATLYIDAVVALPSELLSEDDYDRVRRSLLTARTKVIVETDLPGLTVIEAVLTDARESPGEVNRCSPA